MKIYLASNEKKFDEKLLELSKKDKFLNLDNPNLISFKDLMTLYKELLSLRPENIKYFIIYEDLDENNYPNKLEWDYILKEYDEDNGTTLSNITKETLSLNNHKLPIMEIL